VLRPRLLRSFGWDVLHVLAKDWYEDADAVLGRIEQRLTGEVRAAVEPSSEPTGEAEPLSDRDVWLEKGVAVPSPSSAPAAQPPAAVPPMPTSPPPRPRQTAAPVVPSPQAISQLLCGQTRYFEFVGGTSKKYWHVAVTGSELVVSFGRIGTAGQVKRKAFPSETLARREAEALIREKLGKGYQEVQSA